MSEKWKYFVIQYVKVPRNNHQITFTIYTSFKQTTTYIRSHVKITFIQPISTFQIIQKGMRVSFCDIVGISFKFNSLRQISSDEV